MRVPCPQWLLDRLTRWLFPRVYEMAGKHGRASRSMRVFPGVELVVEVEAVDDGTATRP